MPLAANPNLADVDAGGDGMGDGRAGEGLAEPSAVADGEPARTDGLANPDATVDGAALTGERSPVAGAVGETSPQAAAMTARTTSRAARRTRGRAWAVTAEAGYRDWPLAVAVPVVADPAVPLGPGILAP
jgi:hypothetical protein